MLRMRRMSLRPTTIARLLALGLVLVLVCGLYLPFLGNPRVFDDATFFNGYHFAYYATHPVGLLPRTPAYFTLAVTHVVFERIEAHRIVSLAFHVAVMLALYRFACELQRVVRSPSSPLREEEADARAASGAIVAAGAFALHPAAVYGAGYLVQRSTVLATLFGVLSLWLFLRGIASGRYRFTVLAAGCYALAVLSKEHSVLLAAVALPLAVLAATSLRRAAPHLALYWAACLPAALLAAYMARQVLGQAYEPHVADIAAQVGTASGEASGELTWGLSAATQAGLFFRYLWLWFLPDPAAMSVDWRVDFLATASPGWLAFKVVAFVACGGLGILLLLRRGRLGIAGLGLLYAWVLFLVELSVARFQEPFVIYRSYLWAPGFALVAAAALGRVRPRFALVAFALAAPVLMVQAYDRLTTFSSPLRLWADAADKLPAGPVPWGSRVLYNAGREYLYAGQPEQARTLVERCVATYPDTFQCVYARGAIDLQLGQYERALPHLLRAGEMQPGSGIAQHRIGLALEKLDRIEEARERYRRAMALGYRGGDIELGRLDQQATGDAAARKP